MEYGKFSNDEGSDGYDVLKPERTHLIRSIQPLRGLAGSSCLLDRSCIELGVTRYDPIGFVVKSVTH